MKHFTLALAVAPGVLSVPWCGVGYRLNDTNDCVLCPLGTIQPYSYNSGHLESCFPCNPGSYSANPADAACTIVPQGHRAGHPGSGNSEIVECTPGTYQEYTGMDSCFEAGYGSYVEVYGGKLADVKPCPDDTTTFRRYESDASACIATFAPCSAGFEPVYQNGSGGVVICKGCSGWKYQSVQGTSSVSDNCKYADAGYIVLTDRTGQVACPAGTSSHDNEGSAPLTNTCRPCDAGRYASQSGTTVCPVCPTGYTSESGATSCTLEWCGPGFRVNSGTCTACSAGSYQAQNEFTGTSCTLAKAGYFVSASQASDQAPCPVGKYAPSTGATQCTDAPAGSYVATTGSKVATQCAAGTKQPSTGQTSCINCGLGYVSSQGATTCQACPAGDYSDVVNGSSCKHCAAGTTSSAGSGSCHPLRRRRDSY